MDIHIEYCIKWNYKPKFDRVSELILKLHPNPKISENKSYPRSGAFEVTVNGKLVYSKFQTGDFPDSKIIKEWFNA